jgi:IclR family mhp operon transcriptional activator
MGPGDMERNTGVERGLKVLETLVALGSGSVRDVARRAGLTQQASYRMLEALRAAGYVHRSSYRAPYRLTGKLRALGARVATDALVAEAARAGMAELTRRIGWPLLLSRLEGTEAIAIETTDHLSRHPLPRIQPGARAPAYLWASAVAQVACRPAGESQRLRRQIVAAYGPDMYVTDETLHEKLHHRIRRNGYVIFDALRSEAASAGVPVRVAGVVAFGLDVRFIPRTGRTKLATELIPRLQNLASEISEAMAKTTPP